MADPLTSIDPRKIIPNPGNPRLIFHEEELASLRESIADNGILVPLTVYKSGSNFVLLDGERRWRCAAKLGLARVPVIVQPKPGKLQNLMMMFAIHNARRDWDPLPTAIKLQELEQLYEKEHGRKPKERELAQLASVLIGEVRRLKKLLSLPQRDRDDMMQELKKPRAEQTYSVDQVLESAKGAELLRKQNIIDLPTEQRLRTALVSKFKSGIIRNTVAPRKLARLARAVSRKDVSMETARAAVNELISDPNYTIDQAFESTGAQVDFQHGLEQLVQRVAEKLDDQKRREYALSPKLRNALASLSERIKEILR